MAKQELKAIISADARRFNKTIGTVKRSVANTARLLSGLTFTGGIFSVKQAVNFEKQMAEVNTIANLSKEDLAKLKREVIDLGKELGATTDELAAGLYQALSASIPTNNAIDFLRVATKAATAGVTDVETAVDGITSAINAYGLSAADAAKVSDLFFGTVKLGKITFPQLAGSIGQVAKTAQNAGVPIEELFSAFATLTKQGIKPEESATAINAAILQLVKMTETGSAALQALGFDSGIAAIKNLGLIGTLQELDKLTSRISKSGNNIDILADFGSIRGLKGTLALVGSASDTARDDLDALRNSAGLTDQAFSIMSDTTAKRMSKLQAFVQGLSLTVGEHLLPRLTELTDGLNRSLNNPEVVENLILIVDLMKTFSGVVEKTIKLLFRLGELTSKFSGITAVGDKIQDNLASDEISQSVSPEKLQQLRQFREQGFGVDEIANAFITPSIISIFLQELRGIKENTMPLKGAS